MPKYEYVLVLDSGTTLVNRLNKQGEQGFRIVWVNRKQPFDGNESVIMEREIPDASTVTPHAHMDTYRGPDDDQG